jgi:hypothetical protein
MRELSTFEIIQLMARYVHKEPMRASEELYIKAIQREYPDMDAELASLYLRLAPMPTLDRLVFLTVVEKVAERKFT